MNKWFWNAYANCYDTLTQIEPYRHMLDDLIDAMELQPGMRILNAGCGTGNLEQYLAKRGIDCEVVSVDYSESMLSRAEGKCRGLSVTFQQADLNNPLEFPHESFDRIVSTNVLYTLESPERTLTHLKPLLKRNGRMVHTTPQEGFHMGPIYRAHCRTCTGWKKLSLLKLLPSIFLLYLFNIPLVLQGRSGHYHFPSRDQVEGYLRLDGLQGRLGVTYANQNWLITLERSCHA